MAAMWNSADREPSLSRPLTIEMLLATRRPVPQSRPAGGKPARRWSLRTPRNLPSLCLNLTPELSFGRGL